jgi:two-component sensor histidine kinase
MIAIYDKSPIQRPRSVTTDFKRRAVVRLFPTASLMDRRSNAFGGCRPDCEAAPFRPAIPSSTETVLGLPDRSRELLASELQHRVRNNLHLVIGMLNNYALSAFDDGSRQGSSSISRHVVTLTHIYESLLGIGLTSTT